MDTITGRALVGGELVSLERASLALTDEGVARGDGAFETLGVWDGTPFRVDAHLERLAASLAAVGLPAPDPERVRDAMAQVLDGLGARDAALRVYVTASDSLVVTITAPPLRGPVRRLVPQPAPWIRPLGTYGPAGAKTMSYGPNMAATRAAQRDGGDDALLLSLEGLVLEGPTFCVLWAADGVLHTPDPALGLVDSISRRTLEALARADGVRVERGRYGLEALADADEVMICSSVRDVLPVAEVDGFRFGGPTPVRDRLSGLLDDVRRGRRPLPQ